jgi:hypothetical protein
MLLIEQLLITNAIISPRTRIINNNIQTTSLLLITVKLEEVENVV